MKKIIFNADDLGCSKENNQAVLYGYKSGIITSSSLIVNMAGFEDAVFKINSDLKDMTIGLHFNIIEGKSLTNANLLCDKYGNFNKNFIQIAYYANNKEFLNQIEKELRAQIEKALKYHNISHLDSHVHIHSIPNIFNLFIKTAKEYNIKFIRTQKEIPYITFNKSFNTKYPVNIIKNVLLNTLSRKNIELLNNSDIKTNDYLIGVLYTGMMEENTIINGLKRIKKDNTITEIIIHPYFDPKDSRKKNSCREYLITQNPNFKEKIERLGFVFSDYSDIRSN